MLKTDDGFIKVEVESKTQLFLNQANLERMRKRVSLIKLDETCAPLKSVELFGGEPKLIPGAYKIFQFGKKYCIAYQESKGSDTYTNVKLLSINPQQLTVEKEITAIDFDKYGISFNAKEVLKNNTFMYSSEVSQLGKRVLFYSEIEGSSKSGGVKAILRVVDENFNPNFAIGIILPKSPTLQNGA